MLLTHTAGLWRGGEDGDCPRGDDGLRQYFTAHDGDALWAPPGRLYSYSNAGYGLAAAVLAAISGRRFEDVVTERVLRPSGMATATFDPAAVGSDHATGRALDGGAIVGIEAGDCSLLRAAGGVLASVTDQAHFVETLLSGGGEVLSASSVAAMFADQVATGARAGEHYGYGLGSGPYEGLRLIAHGGRSPGFGSYVALIPERRFGVIALVNVDRSPDGVALRAIDSFLDLPAAPADEPPAPSTWDRYTGDYHDRSGALGHFTVTVEGDHLVLTLLDGGALPASLDGTFFLGPDGRAEYLATPLGIGRRA
jgi:CubicO group peptidase (beta-lactamase class C family)